MSYGIYSRGVVRIQIEPNGVVNRSYAANHLVAGPARPHRFVQCRVVLLSGLARRGQKLNGHRLRIHSRGVVRIQIEPNGVVNRACVANHLAPVRPHRFVRCSVVMRSRPP